jgi:antitoxin (DNA-binding transcriptional repressor) of toxin-antitoxin stability system
MPQNIVGLKELRENMNTYINKVGTGDSFLVLKKSKPVFKISPADEADVWEPVINFTKIKTGGVEINEILSRL